MSLSMRNAIAGPSTINRFARLRVAVRSLQTSPSEPSSDPAVTDNVTKSVDATKTSALAPGKAVAGRTERPRARSRPKGKVQQEHADMVNRLVGLHHAAAGFMRENADVTHAFENNFKLKPHQPHSTVFAQYRGRTLQRLSQRSKSGTVKLEEADEAHQRAAMARRYDSRGPLPALYEPTFRYQPQSTVRPAWMDRDFDEEDEYVKPTDRELQVREALFGTWERGAKGLKGVKPSLDGVNDYLQAKGQTIFEASTEWTDRDRTVEEVQLGNESPAYGEAGALDSAEVSMINDGAQAREAEAAAVEAGEVAADGPNKSPSM